VITARDAPIHTSGHGHREELKLMLALTRPRYVLPIHGDHKRIRLHGELAQAVGIPPKESSPPTTASPSKSTTTARSSGNPSKQE
jgi:ribonuclease J